MPRLDSEVDRSEVFKEDEQLYRRVAPEELVNGELLPISFNIRPSSFTKDIKSSPSVLRSKFASPEDALHPDCTGQKPFAHHFVYWIAVRDLPAKFTSDDGVTFSSFPFHDPEPTCGAHSVIATCKADDLTQKYVKPSRTAVNDLRTKLAVRMQRLTLEATPLAATSMHDAIELRAYGIWEKRGRQQGNADDDWLRAEQEISQTSKT